MSRLASVDLPFTRPYGLPPVETDFAPPDIIDLELLPDGVERGLLDPPGPLKPYVTILVAKVPRGDPSKHTRKPGARP